jgi:hypothetical protein
LGIIFSIAVSANMWKYSRERLCTIITLLVTLTISLSVGRVLFTLSSDILTSPNNIRAELVETRELAHIGASSRPYYYIPRDNLYIYLNSENETSRLDTYRYYFKNKWNYLFGKPSFDDYYYAYLPEDSLIEINPFR